MQENSSQLVFGKDAIPNTKFEANWALIKQRKQKIIDMNNSRENNDRVRLSYKIRTTGYYTRSQPLTNLEKFHGKVHTP
jgi:hypothetical protein